MRRDTPQDLVHRLQPVHPSTKPHDLGLLRRRLTVLDPAIDIGLLHPAAHGLLRHPEVDSNLRDAQVTLAGDRDHVPLQLRRGTSSAWQRCSPRSHSRVNDVNRFDSNPDSEESGRVMVIGVHQLSMALSSY